MCREGEGERGRDREGGEREKDKRVYTFYFSYNFQTLFTGFLYYQTLWKTLPSANSWLDINLAAQCSGPVVELVDDAEDCDTRPRLW